ncbi:hypothetical protein [Brevibacillus sp. MER 51]|uniref:hypothetical protein n=1 Tax=Brevibacillus sp. MER 51 TaxID=2939560 RepID=UPI00203BEBDE|nr:hypothetical protein [Brevibacillus sp. MER 51]MCM3143918.1 hypothetical protein [Brevibacillus sp. MER 51]
MAEEETIKQAVQEVQNQIAYRLFQEGVEDISFICRVCEPTKAVIKDIEKRILYKHMTKIQQIFEQEKDEAVEKAIENVLSKQSIKLIEANNELPPAQQMTTEHMTKRVSGKDPTLRPMRTETPSFSIQDEKAIGETVETTRSEVSMALADDESLRLNELEPKHLSDKKARRSGEGLLEEEEQGDIIQSSGTD